MLHKNINLQKYLEKQIIYINSSLKKNLAQYVRYSVLVCGKRLRQILALLASNLFGLKSDNVIPAACAIEYLHTYSLVHNVIYQQ
jgi:geranylgeranyl diphosphate synthase type II